MLAPQIAEGPLLIGQPHGPQRGILAQARNPTPVAEPTTRRQHNPREEPDALAGMSGSVRGVPSNGDPYRDQHPPAAGDPLMPRAVLVHHHARKRAARALTPVCAAARCRPPAPIRLQGQPHPVVAALTAVLRHQLLVEVLGGEVPVAGVEERARTPATSSIGARRAERRPRRRS